MDSLKITDYNAKIYEIESIIPGIAGLATTTPLNAVENNIPNVSNLVKKTGSDEKISDIGTNYFNISNYRTFLREILDAKIKENELVSKFDIY